MELRVKDLGLSTGGTLIVVLNKQDAEELDLYANDRIKLQKGKKEIIAVLDISESNHLKKDEIGLFEEVLTYLNAKDKDKVNISLAPPPESLKYIKKKLDGSILAKEEFDIIVKDVLNNNLTEAELSYFVSGCYVKKLKDAEVINLTKAIIENGEKLNLNKKIILDKHSTGGIPGNKTTPIIVSIVAAAGFTIPKTSSRAISSAAGTADAVETIANVSLSIEKIRKVVQKTNGCIVWGGGINLASADDKLIRVRYSLGLDPEGMLLASILAKKAAVGATHLLIDLPIGTKLKTKKKANNLKRKFIKIGKKLGIKVKVIITDGSQPIGNGVGPALEIRDVLLVLQNRGSIPLKEKSIKMSGMLLALAGVKDAESKAREILELGFAYQKFKEIIKEQEGNENIMPEQIKIGNFSKAIRAAKQGIITHIDNKIIFKIARLAGAPKIKEAGLYLNYHKGERVSKEDILFKVYSSNQKRLENAEEFLKKNNPIIIS